MNKWLFLTCLPVVIVMPALRAVEPGPVKAPTKPSSEIKWYTPEFRFPPQSGPHIGRMESKLIILINDAKLHTAPGLESEHLKFYLRAGQRVVLLDKMPGPGASQERRTTWYRVKTGRWEGWLPDAYITVEPVVKYDPGMGTIGLEPVDRVHGISPDYTPADLVSVPYGYNKSRTYYLRSEVTEAMERMIRSAKRDGIELFLISAYRSWQRQQAIYERKVLNSMDGIHQKTVAKPGHSEHQLGTAIDLNGEAQNTMLRRRFSETEEGRWLVEQAPDYGFALSYTEHNEPVTGYSPEPWHYRYWGVEMARIKHDEALGRNRTESPPGSTKRASLDFRMEEQDSASRDRFGKE
jgi:LAS superfamily LD-carboxypeptidase LdcB